LRKRLGTPHAAEITDDGDLRRLPAGIHLVSQPRRQELEGQADRDAQILASGARADGVIGRLDFLQQRQDFHPPLSLQKRRRRPQLER